MTIARPVYKHYFCKECGEKKRGTLPDGPSMGIETRWGDFEAAGYTCGQWQEQSILKEGRGCGKPAFLMLEATGGNPIIYMSVDARPLMYGGDVEVSD